MNNSIYNILHNKTKIKIEDRYPLEKFHTFAAIILVIAPIFFLFVFFTIFFRLMLWRRKIVQPQQLKDVVKITFNDKKFNNSF